MNSNYEVQYESARCAKKPNPNPNPISQFPNAVIEAGKGGVNAARQSFNDAQLAGLFIDFNHQYESGNLDQGDNKFEAFYQYVKDKNKEHLLAGQSDAETFGEGVGQFLGSVAGAIAKAPLDIGMYISGAQVYLEYARQRHQGASASQATGKLTTQQIASTVGQGVLDLALMGIGQTINSAGKPAIEALFKKNPELKGAVLEAATELVGQSTITSLQMEGASRDEIAKAIAIQTLSTLGLNGFMRWVGSRGSKTPDSTSTPGNRTRAGESDSIPPTPSTPGTKVGNPQSPPPPRSEVVTVGSHKVNLETSSSGKVSGTMQVGNKQIPVERVGDSFEVVADNGSKIRIDSRGTATISQNGVDIRGAIDVVDNKIGITQNSGGHQAFFDGQTAKVNSGGGWGQPRPTSTFPVVHLEGQGYFHRGQLKDGTPFLVRDNAVVFNQKTVAGEFVGEIEGGISVRKDDGTYEVVGGTLNGKVGIQVGGGNKPTVRYGDSISELEQKKVVTATEQVGGVAARVHRSSDGRIAVNDGRLVKGHPSALNGTPGVKVEGSSEGAGIFIPGTKAGHPRVEINGSYDTEVKGGIVQNIGDSPFVTKDVQDFRVIIKPGSGEVSVKLKGQSGEISLGPNINPNDMSISKDGSEIRFQVKGDSSQSVVVRRQGDKLVKDGDGESVTAARAVSLEEVPIDKPIARVNPGMNSDEIARILKEKGVRIEHQQGGGPGYLDISSLPGGKVDPKFVRIDPLGNVIYQDPNGIIGHLVDSNGQRFRAGDLLEVEAQAKMGEASGVERSKIEDDAESLVGLHGEDGFQDLVKDEVSGRSPEQLVEMLVHLNGLEQSEATQAVRDHLLGAIEPFINDKNITAILTGLQESEQFKTLEDIVKLGLKSTAKGTHGVVQQTRKWLSSPNGLQTLKSVLGESEEMVKNLVNENSPLFGAHFPDEVLGELLGVEGVDNIYKALKFDERSGKTQNEWFKIRLTGENRFQAYQSILHAAMEKMSIQESYFKELSVGKTNKKGFEAEIKYKGEVVGTVRFQKGQSEANKKHSDPNYEYLHLLFENVQQPDPNNTVTIRWHPKHFDYTDKEKKNIRMPQYRIEKGNEYFVASQGNQGGFAVVGNNRTLQDNSHFDFFPPSTPPSVVQPEPSN